MSKVNINGTVYDIYLGETLINNTIYQIQNGDTLIDGTKVQINFPTAPKFFTVTIAGTGNINNSYITINKQKYYQPITLRLSQGTKLECTSNIIRLNEQFQGTSYIYSLNKNITIKFSTILGNLIKIINITEEV